MLFFTVLKDYFIWHYSRAYTDIFHIWRNFTHFAFHFFSIPLLIRTLFKPWKRLEAERETQGFNLQDYLSTKLVNLMMRLVGATMRTGLIAVGLAVVGVIVVAGAGFFVVWTFLPLIVVLFSFIAGIHLIIFG